jgi:hypothetical protein
MTSPFFLDWISRKRLAQEEKTDWPAWITSNAALYYDEVFSETRHGSALPPSVKTVQDATNYAYPTTLVESYLEEIRVRMTLAPNTKVTFSAGKQLASMGFSDAQIGERKGKKQFVFENKSMTEFLTIQADEQPLEKLLVTTLSIRVYPASENIVSRVEEFVVTQKQLRKNTELVKSISLALDNLSTKTNLKFNITYTAPQFSLSFPENTDIDASLNVPVDLAFRLGYGFVTQIKKGAVAEPRPDRYDTSNTAAKARALVYDTAQVIVTMENTSSNLNSVTGDIVVATLYPTPQGSIEMLPSSLFLPPPMVKLPFFASGTNTVPVTFQLSRFNDDESLMPFYWKTASYLSGTLRGTMHREGGKV